MHSIFKLYKKGAPKSFQRYGNHMEVSSFIAQYRADNMPQIVSDWFEITQPIEVNSVKLYRYGIEDLYSSFDYDDLVLKRTEDQTINTRGSIYQQSGNKVRFIIDSKKFAGKLKNFYVYELVISTTETDYESDIFTTSDDYYSKADFQCSNANINNILFEQTPEFTIDVTELNGVTGDATISVIWDVPSKLVFGGIFFPAKFGGRTSFQDSEIKSFAGGDTKTYSFVLNEILPPGNYSISFESDFAGCQGTLYFSVANYFSIDALNSGWDTDGATGDDDNQTIDFNLKVDNSDVVARTCYITFNKNGVIYIFDPIEIPAGSSYIFSKTYTNINRYNGNIMDVSGSVGGSYELGVLTPPSGG